MKGRRDLKDFVELPYRLMAKESRWVAPLRVEAKWRLSPHRNPFFEHAEVKLLLVRRRGIVVGRAATFIDYNYDVLYGDDALLFGWFDCENDPEVACVLFETLTKEALRRGRTRLIGPLTFSMNEEAGILVEGFDEPHYIMTPYNPTWYPRLFEDNGFVKLQDMLAYSWLLDKKLPLKLLKISELVIGKKRVEISCIRMDQFRKEVEALFVIYNDAFETTWGHVPLTWKEFDNMTKYFRRFCEPQLIFIVRVNSVPAGFGLTIPDWNQAISKAQGRLFPFGLFRVLMTRRHIDTARFIVLAVRQHFRGRGLEAPIILRTIENAKRLGYKHGEMSMVLESNVPMRRILENLFERRPYRRFRIYQKCLKGDNLF
jgi:GNAT superfamily N-acetyltransferase